jgi:hypothetical protein
VAEPGTVPAPGRSGDDQVDVFQPCGLRIQASPHRPCRRRGEVLIDRGRLIEPQHITRIGESHCGRECFSIVGHIVRVHPGHAAQAVVVIGPSAQQGRPGGRKRKVLAHAMTRIGVTGHHQRTVDAVGPQEPVDDLQCGQYPADAIGDVERERAVRTGVGILGVGPDVVLDQRGQRRLPQVAVAVYPRVDHEIQLVRVASGALQAVLGGGDGEVQRAVPVPPPRVHEVDSINDRAHSGPPNPHPGSVGPHRSPIPRPTRAARPFLRARCVRPRVPRRAPRCGSSMPCCRTGRR